MQHTISLPILLLIAVPPLAETKAADWSTGSEFRKRLELPVAFTWSENPLRRAVSKLARNQQVAIYLDRRIDPSQPIDLSVPDGPLDHALLKLAGSLELGVSYLDPVVYIGPPSVADRLATLAAIRREDVGRLEAEPRSRWRRATAWQWKRLTTPQELLDQLARETGVRVVNPQAVPHDLWPATDLPAMPATDRLSLLLAGFSLTFEISQDGSAVRLIAMPEAVSLERLYRPRGDLQQASQRLAEVFPQISVNRVGQRLKVAATYEDHLLIARWMRGETIHRTDAIVAEWRYRHTLEIENVPAGAVVKKIAEQLKLTLEVAPELEDTLRQRVSIHVDDVPLDELLRAALDPIGVRFQLQDKTLKILAPKP